MKKVLHIVGSLNQTQQLHRVAQRMPDYDHYFTQYFGSGNFFKYLAEHGMVDFTIMGTNSSFRKLQAEYLEKHNCQYDYRGTTLGNKYDLVVICSDMMIPKEIEYAPVVWIQEGMTDEMTTLSKLVNKANLPAWLTGDTSLNGCSNKCNYYCAASHGYAEHFASMGTDTDKLFITGIPNFDNMEAFRNNDFPLKDYVLVCTTDMRETKRKDDRKGFLKRCKKIAGDRELIFKLHPNEKTDRAIAEIREIIDPNTKVYTKGNTDHMIANCCELITQYSSVVYVGMGLGIPVHSYFDMDMLNARMPQQNGGVSAQRIADICTDVIEYGNVQKTLRNQFGYKPKTAVAHG